MNKRIPRKEGQPAKSDKHSDLYTDEDPKGTIQGLQFKNKRAAACNNQPAQFLPSTRLVRLQGSLGLGFLRLDLVLKVKVLSKAWKMQAYVRLCDEEVNNQSIGCQHMQNLFLRLKICGRVDCSYFQNPEDTFHQLQTIITNC